MKLSSIAILLGAAVTAAPNVVSAHTLRGNYLQGLVQADAFFANPERHDCEGGGVNTCSRLGHCAQELDSRGNPVANSCLELVDDCSDATWTICHNAVQMSSSRSTHQDLALCEWSGSRRNGSCTMPNRRRDRTYVSVEQSRDAAPRPVNSLPQMVDFVEEDVTDSSEDMPSVSGDEEGEDSSTSEDYADSY